MMISIMMINMGHLLIFDDYYYYILTTIKIYSSIDIKNIHSFLKKKCKRKPIIWLFIIIIIIHLLLLLSRID